MSIEEAEEYILKFRIAVGEGTWLYLPEDEIDKINEAFKIMDESITRNLKANFIIRQKV